MVMHCVGKNIAGYHECGKCRKVFIVRTSTVKEQSLQNWTIDSYQDVTSSNGISSIQLSKHLGITQKSARFMLGRIQRGVGKNGGVSGSGCHL